MSSYGSDPDHMGIDYFRAMYSVHDDPWGFDDRWYEQRKYALTMAALPRRSYDRCFEPGCANGALTELIATRCNQVVAADFVASAVDRARHRLDGIEHVTVACEQFPRWWPAGDGDLVIWSEIAYYLTDEGASDAVNGLRRWLRPGGDLVAVHYLGATNYPRTGASIARWLDDQRFLDRLVEHREAEFELAVWRRRSERWSRAISGEARR
ncbi:MAG: SAM-dependent methyltransferase [Aquihabitans sp.]